MSSFQINFNQIQGKWAQLASSPIPLQSNAKNVWVECSVNDNGTQAEIKTSFEEPGLIFGESQGTSFAKAKTQKDFKKDENVVFSFLAQPDNPPSGYISSVKNSARQKIISAMFRASGISEGQSNYIIPGMGKNWFSLAYINKSYGFIFVRTFDKKELKKIVPQAFASLANFGVDTSKIEDSERTEEFENEMEQYFTQLKTKIEKKTGCSCSCGCHLT